MILQSAVNNLDFRGVGGGGGTIKIVVENWVAKTKRLRNAAIHERYLDLFERLENQNENEPLL
jgi:hypothetical protein